MQVRRIAVIAAAAAVAAVGAGVAVATTGGGDGKKVEQAVLNDAAKRLNVSPSELRDALAAAENAQLDQLVKDGKLTQKQADAIKARRKQSGRVLGFGGPRGPHFFGRFGHGPGPGFGPGPRFGPGFNLFGDLASALGITRQQLVTDLESGKTLSQIAKAHGKSVSDVKASVKTAAKKRLDAEVKKGNLTEAQENAILDGLSAHLDHFGEGPRFGFHRELRRAPFPGSYGGDVQPAPAPGNAELPAPPIEAF